MDEYRFADDVLRWRSRLPSDPSFDNTALTYEIDYELGRILVATRGGGERRYVLDNDFAFADRPGSIERFVLSLELDPAWHSGRPLPERFTAGPLAPGQSFVVRRELTYSGAATPAVAFAAAAPLARYTAIALLLAGIPTIFARFWLGERARGRFAREQAVIDEGWLEEHVFHQLPEVVGYMYDGKSGPQEVAAILARMAQEGKITSRVERRRLRAPLLRMTLVDTDAHLHRQERQLVAMFFFEGSHETDTDTIRKHYRKRGFDPGKTIEPSLSGAALRHRDWSENVPRQWGRREKLVLPAAYALLVTGAFFGFSSLWLMIYMGVLGGVACAIGCGVARASANRMRRLPVWWLGASLPILLVAWLLGSIARREASHVREYPFLVAAVFVLVVYWFVMRAARTRQSKEKMLLRARIDAARRWFAGELRRPSPAAARRVGPVPDRAGARARRRSLVLVVRRAGLGSRRARRVLDRCGADVVVGTGVVDGRSQRLDGRRRRLRRGRGNGFVGARGDLAGSRQQRCRELVGLGRRRALVGRGQLLSSSSSSGGGGGGGW